jgi:peptidoglycan/LPS O-acetylase OafA/YrhL
MTIARQIYAGSGDSGIRPKQDEAHPPHNSSIDGLRALAVLSVMLYHLNGKFLTGGFVGVDVFFVISGYVVAKSILDRSFSSFSELVLFFYARRFLRILPALIAMLFITSLATVAFVPDGWLSDSNRDTALYAFVGISNVRLARAAGNDYFGPKTDFNPFAHTWSLGVEEQFYLIFPFLIASAVLFLSRRRLGIIAASVLTILSFGLSAALTSKAPIFSFYQIPARFWELGIGLLLALTLVTWQKWLNRVRTSSVSLCASYCLAILGASFFFCNEAEFPFPWAIPPVLATAGLLMIVSTDRKSLPSTFLSMKWLSFIGLISYSLYLWHWPIYVLMRWTSGLETPVQQLGALVLTFASAVTSYYLVECPVRYSGRLAILPRSAVVALFGVVTFSAAVVSGEAFQFRKHLSLSVTANDEIWSNSAPPNVGCVASPTEKEIANPSRKACKMGGGRHLLVVGDSHAGAYSRMLAKFSQDYDVPVTIYTSPGCAFFSLRVPVRMLPGNCARSLEVFQKDMLAKAGAGTTVFLASLRLDRLRDQWGGNNAPMPSVNKESVDEARAFIADLSRRGSTVILEAPTPIFWSPPFRCADWFNKHNPICREGFDIDWSFFEARREEVVEAERSIASSLDRVTIWDPALVLCKPLYCRAFESGKPLFYDGDHLSGYANDVLYPAFARELTRSQAAVNR